MESSTNNNNTWRLSNKNLVRKKLSNSYEWEKKLCSSSSVPMFLLIFPFYCWLAGLFLLLVPRHNLSFVNRCLEVEQRSDLLDYQPMIFVVNQHEMFHHWDRWASKCLLSTIYEIRINVLWSSHLVKSDSQEALRYPHCGQHDHLPLRHASVMVLVNCF
jgi:hypothetical protein